MRKLFNNSIRISTPEWAVEANLITRYNARYFSHFNYHVKFWRTNQAPGLSGVVKSVFQHSLFCCSLKAPQFPFFSLKQGKHRIVGHSHIYTTSFKLGKAPMTESFHEMMELL